MYDRILKLAHQFYRLAAVPRPETEAGRALPEAVFTEPVVQGYPDKEVLKVFKHYKLNDFRVPFEWKSGIAINLFGAIVRVLGELVVKLNALQTQLTPDENGPEVSEETQKKITALSNLGWQIGAINRQVVHSEFLDQKNHRLIREIKSDSDDSKAYPVGMSIFKVYNSIKDRAKQFGLDIPDLESLPEFKHYSQRGEFEIVFSTKFEDLVGMGWRGVRTCQTLDPVVERGEFGFFSRHVLGSALCRFVGLIYLTSGHTYKGRGEKMINRAIVRLGVDKRTRQPVIVLDNFYPAMYKDIADAMMKEIEKRTTINVVFGEDYRDVVYLLDDPHVKKYKDDHVSPYVNAEYYGKRERPEKTATQVFEEKLLDNLQSKKYKFNLAKEFGEAFRDLGLKFKPVRTRRATITRKNLNEELRANNERFMSVFLRELIGFGLDKFRDLEKDYSTSYSGGTRKKKPISFSENTMLKYLTKWLDSPAGLSHASWAIEIVFRTYHFEGTQAVMQSLDYKEQEEIKKMLATKAMQRVLGTLGI